MMDQKKILPGAVIGIVGGGQLGQMMALSAKEMGYRVCILDPTPNCSAAQVSDDHIVAAYNDTTAIEDLMRRSDVVTFEFENVNADAIDAYTELSWVPQGTELLRIASDRIREKTFLQENSVPVAPFRPVTTRADLMAALEMLGYPAVLKTTRFGYDGKGQCVLRGEADIDAAMQLVDAQPCVLEQMIPFIKEISIMVCRSTDGTAVTWPVSENIHINNILHTCIVPARITDEAMQQVHAYAKLIARRIDLIGTLGIELFYLADGTILVNELAPRPHNSGHYTIEACDFSQFDGHIKAITGQPLAAPSLLSPALMINVLGQHVAGVETEMFRQPSWHVHLYGKAEAVNNRKMGHITLLTASHNTALTALNELGIWNKGEN